MDLNDEQASSIKRRLSDRALFWLFALLFAADMLIPVVLGPFYSNYSHLHDTLSTLGHQQSPVAGITAAWLVIFGIALCVLTALDWQRSSHTRPRRLFSLGLLAFAIGAGVVAGLFPEDLPGEAETLNGKLHGIGAGLGSLGLLAGLVGRALSVRGRNRYLIIALTGIAWIGFALFLGSNAPEMFAGLWQKLYLGAAYLAVVVVIRSCR